MKHIICYLLLTIPVFAWSQNKMVIKKTPQKLDTVSVTGDILKISLSGDGEPAKEVTLPTGGGGGTDGITQVASVAALRATSGTSTKDIYLKSYWSGLNYGGGRFTWHSTDITGRGDDGGISFSASGGGYWVRNDPEFRATYFGLVDTSDLDAISKVDNTHEADNLTNQIPDGGKIVFDPGFVFKSMGGFNWGFDQYKTIHIEGYGSTLLRGEQIQDSVKSNSSTWVRVAHPERWDTFQYIALYDGTDRMAFDSRIERISGDTLFAGIGVGDYSTGDCYSQSYQIVLLKDGCTLRGLTLDGNLDQNTLYNYWGTSGAVYISSNNSFINRITIKNSPGEGILLFEDNVILDGFNIQNCNGNGVHLGSNNNYQILNGVIKNVNNLIRRDEIMTMGHEGGAIAHSQDVHGGMISNIQIDSAYAAIGDLNGHDDSLNIYDRIDAKNCIKAVEVSQLYGGQTLRDLRFTNSRFYNCGTFEIKSNSSGPTDSTEYARDILLSDVYFYNTVLSLNARSFNVNLNNIFYQDTSNTDLSIVYSPDLKINGLVKNGGGRIYIEGSNGMVLENFELKDVNSSVCHIYGPDAGTIIIRNGAIYQNSSASGFVAIYGQVGGEISDVFINLKGSPTYGIFANASSTQVATTVKNCTILTPTGVPSIRCYGGSSGGLFINNKMNNDISNISGNDAYGNINVTNDDVTWGNTTTLKILGKIRDSAGNLGTDGQVLTADASGFTVWETPAAGSGLSGSGTTNKVTKWTGTSTLGNSQITDDGVDISMDAAGKIALNVGSAGTNGIDYERAGVIEGSLNTAVYNTTYNGSMFGHNLSQAFAHINTALNAYYMDLGGRGSSGIGGTSSGIFFGMKAASTSTETNLLTLDENGNVGIGGVTAPAQKLHVSGTARITGSDGTATTITGRDGDGDISNVSLGYGLNLVGGTLEVDTTEVATPGDLAALGGATGDITAVNVTGYLTGGGTSGDVTIGIDTTGTVGVATKYDLTSLSTGGITSLNGLTAGTQTFATGTSGTDFNINSSTSTHTFNLPTASGTNRGLLSSSDHTTFSNKIGGSGSASRIPYFATSSTITGDEQWMVLNTTGNYIAGVGFTGGNSQFSNYLETGASGYVAYDASGIAGIGLATSSSNRWAMMNNSSGTLYWNRNSGGGWSGTPYMSLSSGGAFKLSDLAGSGTRMVVASSTGVLSTQAIPSAGVSSVSGTGTIIASPTTGAVSISDAQASAGMVWNPGAQTFTISNAAPTKVLFSNSSTNNTVEASAITDQIKVTIAGKYMITYSATVRSDLTSGTGTPDNSFGLHINGTLSSNGTWAESGSPSGAYVNISKSVILNLSANDIVTLHHYSITGSTFNTQILGAHMSCQRVW